MQYLYSTITRRKIAITTWLFSGTNVRSKKQLLSIRSGGTHLNFSQALILKELSEVRESAGKLCLQELQRSSNSPLIMVLSGSKG